MYINQSYKFVAKADAKFRLRWGYIMYLSGPGDLIDYESPGVPRRSHSLYFATMDDALEFKKLYVDVHDDWSEIITL